MEHSRSVNDVSWAFSLRLQLHVLTNRPRDRKPSWSPSCPGLWSRPNRGRARNRNRVPLPVGNTVGEVGGVAKETRQSSRQHSKDLTNPHLHHWNQLIQLIGGDSL